MWTLVHCLRQNKYTAMLFDETPSSILSRLAFLFFVLLSLQCLSQTILVHAILMFSFPGFPILTQAHLLPNFVLNRLHRS
jgi:hypothetical protein